MSIADNDTGIQFRFRSYPPPAPIINYPALTEGVGAVVLGIVRGDDGNQSVTVELAATDLTATNGADYIRPTNTVSFGPTERLKFVSVVILNNSLKQPNRSFLLTLSNPAGGTLGSTRTTTVMIADDDQGFEFESATSSVAEDAGAALVRVLQGSDDTNASVTVDHATADLSATNGVDYNATSGTLSFAPGEKLKVVRVPILNLNDGVKEAAESFHLTLSNPTGGAVLGARTTTTTTIQDNDPGMSFELSNQAVWEKAGEVVLTVVRGNDGALGLVAVDYATSDRTAKAGGCARPITGVIPLVVIEHGLEVRPLECLQVARASRGIGHPGGQSLRREVRVCALALKLAGVGAVFLLLRVVDQLPHEAARVRQVEHDQFLGHFRSRHGKGPRHGSAPVVADNDRLVLSARLDDGGNILDKEAHVVLFHPGRLVTQVVTPLVDGYDAVISGQGLHLMTPS